MTALFAQQQTAILVHNDNTFTPYYGPNAFIQAHAAAQTGETINLSAGAFNSCGALTKGIIIRGNGIDGPIAERTYITGNIYQRIADSNNSTLNIEGIYFDNLFENDSVCKSLTMTHCVINGEFRIYNRYTMFTLINCIVRDLSNNSSYSDNSSIYAALINCYVNHHVNHYTVHMYNCVCKIESTYFFHSPHYYQNCIIYGAPYANNPYPYDYYQHLDHCTIINTGDTNMFGSWSMNTGTDNVERTFSSVFESFRGGDLDDQTSFELTGYAQTHYLGSDSTQVGIYGGVRPWTSALTYPKIVNMTVPHQTTSAGMLGVSVEIRQGE